VLGLVLLGAPAQAAPGPHQGRITGVAGSFEEADALPCWNATGHDYVGAACFPKLSPAWHVEQPNSCTIRSDVTTGFRLMGNCVIAKDEGDHVKVWAPFGAVDQQFTLVWEG
jgi:hypothetical protein